MPRQTRWVLILAGLLPLSVSVLAIFFWPLAMPGLLVANAGVGRIVGGRVSHRPFLAATGVAAAGWVASTVAVGIIATTISRPGSGNTDAQGLGILAAFLLMAGLVTSPLAGWVASRWNARRGDTPENRSLDQV